MTAKKAPAKKNAMPPKRPGPRGTSATTTSLATAITVGVTATALPAATLANRNTIRIQNATSEVPTVIVGTAAAPVADAVIADTGAMTAGRYRVVVECGSDDTAAVNKHLAIEHRDAANTGNVSRIIVPVPGGRRAEFRVSLATNERVRVKAGGAAGAASSQYAARIEYVRFPYLYIGAAGVTTATGIRLAPGESTPVIDQLGPLFGIADEAGVDVRVRETGSS